MWSFHPPLCACPEVSAGPSVLRYYITDRSALGGESALLQQIERLGSSIDVLQVREKDLSAAALTRLVREAVRVAPPDVRILVNDRADVAVAAGAHGVHLRSHAPPPRIFLSLAPGFLVSVSCHSIEEVARASDEGADFILLAPIFATPRKGRPLGLETLAAAVRVSRSPVIALGGVSERNTASCLRAGAAGVAGIRMFQSGAR